MGVFGEYGLTISETKQKRALEKKDVNAAIPPDLEHTTIDRLVQMAGDYEFVVSLCFCMLRIDDSCVVLVAVLLLSIWINPKPRRSHANFSSV